MRHVEQLLDDLRSKIKHKNIEIKKLQTECEVLTEIEWRLESAIEKDKEPTQ
jgi:hypothetical protein